jgi:MFS family permease
MKDPASQTRNRLLLLLFIGVLMGALDIAIVGPALPAIQKSFGVDERAIAWIFSIYVLFSLVGTPLMAKLSDAYGRRSIYALDVTIFAIGSLLVALAPTFAFVLVGRAIQGLGAGGIFPVASAVIGDTFPPEKRGSALGLIGAVFGIAFLIGPILGGLLLLAGWQWLFVVNLPIAAIIIVLTMMWLPAAPPPQRRPFDWAGMAVLGALLAALAYGINRIDTAHFGASLASTGVWPFLLIAVVLIPAFRQVERSAQDPVLRLGLFSSRQVVLASGVAVGAGLSESALVFVPSLAVAAFGVASSTASFMLLPVVLAMAIGSPLAGRMLDQRGSRVVILSATVLLAIGMFLLGTLGSQIIFFYIAGLLIGVGLAMMLGAPLRYIMLNEAPAAERAAAQGAIALFTSVGQLLGGAVVGAVAASLGGGVGGYQAAYLAIGVLAVVLAVLASGLKGRAAEMETVRRNEA